MFLRLSENFVDHTFVIPLPIENFVDQKVKEEIENGNKLQAPLSNVN